MGGETSNTTVAILVAVAGALGAGLAKVVDVVLAWRKASHETRAADHKTTLTEWQDMVERVVARNEQFHAEIKELRARLLESEVARARAEARVEVLESAARGEDGGAS